ncbi:MAG: HAMP domain-containing protein [Candidatus Omnitrophota bacterium]
MTGPIFIKRRREYIVKTGLQFRYVGVVLALVLFAFSVSGFTVFVTGWSLFTQKLAAVYPQGRLLYVLRGINLALLKNLLFILPIVFLLAVLFSHKIAGPVLRIERTIDEIRKGNLAKRIKLRTGDELWDLADTINTMVEAVDKDISISKEIAFKIQKRMDNTKNEFSKDSWNRSDIESSIDAMQSDLKGLSESLNKWSTTK